jgi:hypothetical protein
LGLEYVSEPAPEVKITKPAGLPDELELLPECAADSTVIVAPGGELAAVIVALEKVTIPAEYAIDPLVLDTGTKVAGIVVLV